MLANVPRVITRSLPRRAPKELKSGFSTPRASSHAAEGPSTGMSQAGLVWSVVTESPRTARHRAPRIGATGEGSRGSPAKNGGSCTYVLDASQGYVVPA